MTFLLPPGIKWLRFQNKQLKIQQLNQTFSPKNIWSKNHQNFSTIWFASWDITWILIYYLNAYYTILCPKDMSNGIQAIDKINGLLSVTNVCTNTFHDCAMTYTYYTWKYYPQNFCGMRSFNESNASML